MSVLTPKRVVLFFAAVFVGTAAFGSYPSPRTTARMAYDPATKTVVLFGGRGPTDPATAVAHASGETWLWTGGSWVQRFPATQPPARDLQEMVYDAAIGRVVMFGGRQEPSERDGLAVLLNDTWEWTGDDWTKVETADAPSPRQQFAMAYDSDRQKVVLFGGNVYKADGKTIEPSFETWEFDGTNWTRVAVDAPRVAKPIMAYDATNKEMLLIGIVETTFAAEMYRYDASARTWTKVTPAKMPTCVNEGHMVFQEHTGRVIFFGGICTSNTPGGDEVFEWDGETWTKVDMTAITRGVGQAVAYDPLFRRVIFFGGTLLFDATPGATTVFLEDNKWRYAPIVATRPAPRSLMTVQSDAANNAVWLVGGLDEASASFYSDFWGYRNGQWFQVPTTTGPANGCDSPVSAFDTDRSVFVLNCSGSTTYEWNGTAWKSFTSLKKTPPLRRWAGMVYDAKLKKTVLFGGYNVGNFRDDVWTWNGTEWSEVNVSGDEPMRRAQMAMWFDPIQQKTIIYGGVGRKNIYENVTRLDDMWSFDGSRWTKITTTTPGQRFGPQIAVNPTTGKLLLFGGLRAESIDADSIRQFFDNDTWEWDGATSKWTRLDVNTAPGAGALPPVRENGALAWDPSSGKFMMFGGYANGFYRSDTWTFDGVNWKPVLENGSRRRAAGR